MPADLVKPAPQRSLTISKAAEINQPALFGNQPSRLSAWRLFVSLEMPNMIRSSLFEIAQCARGCRSRCPSVATWLLQIEGKMR
jgi:hypothetical protein